MVLTRRNTTATKAGTLSRSADFQSAVSQAFSLLGAGLGPASQRFARLPTKSRRYSRPEVCATSVHKRGFVRLQEGVGVFLPALKRRALAAESPTLSSRFTQRHWPRLIAFVGNRAQRRFAARHALGKRRIGDKFRP